MTPGKRFEADIQKFIPTNIFYCLEKNTPTDS